MSYKSNLKQYRLSHNLTQKAMADKCGINIRLYQKYEYGDSLPNVNTAISIAKSLNSTVEDLFPLSEE